MSILPLLLNSDLRAEILRILFGIRNEDLYVAQITGLTKYKGASVEEELEKLLKLELLITTKKHHRRYYAANPTHPLFPELRSMVLKTVGLTDILAEALNSEKIDFAFVFGSIAATNEKASSDVDLMIIGTLGHREIASQLRALNDRLGREINPHFFSSAEFQKRINDKDHFICEVLSKPKLFIKGDENEFENIFGRRMAASA